MAPTLAGSGTRAPWRRPLTVALAVVLIFLLLLAAVWLPRKSDVGPSGLDRILVDLEEQVRKNPQDVDARIAVALAYGERGYYDRAVAQFKQALVLDEGNQPALIGLGKALFEDKQYQEAEQPLRQVVELNANNQFRYSIEQLQEVHYYLARVYLQLRRYDEGSVAAEEALKINRTDADTWRVLGNLEHGRGDLAAAEQAYLTATAFVPNYIEAYEDLGRVYKAMNREGARLYTEGMVLLARKLPVEALSRLEVAAQREPQMAEAHQGLAMAYESVGRRDEALTSYRRALEIAPALFLSQSAVQRLEAPGGSGTPTGAR